MTTIHSIVDEGLGNSSYLVDIGDGRALVVDPSRDPTAYLRLAEANGLNVAYAAETHLHADFVSGSRELSAHGARVIASSLGHRPFSHLGVRDGEEVDLGGLTLRALATPGHTPEHVSYLLLDGSRSIALFTGGSLLVGAVARTDLVDPDRGEHYARMLYRSLRDKLHDLPDELSLYPTHGAGSFCSAPTGGERPRPSGASVPQIRSWRRTTRTISRRCCSPVWDPTLRTSCGCKKSTEAGRQSLARHLPCDPWRRTPCASW